MRRKIRCRFQTFRVCLWEPLLHFAYFYNSTDRVSLENRLPIGVLLIAVGKRSIKDAVAEKRNEGRAIAWKPQILMANVESFPRD